jgi:hypothetical protein
MTQAMLSAAARVPPTRTSVTPGCGASTPTRSGRSWKPSLRRNEIHKAYTTPSRRRRPPDWAPISFDGKLHDRASYRYYWQVLERRTRPAGSFPAEARGWFSDRASLSPPPPQRRRKPHEKLHASLFCRTVLIALLAPPPAVAQTTGTAKPRPNQPQKAACQSFQAGANLKSASEERRHAGLRMPKPTLTPAELAIAKRVHVGKHALRTGRRGRDRPMPSAPAIST